jgi:hypothetical protein
VSSTDGATLPSDGGPGKDAATKGDAAASGCVPACNPGQVCASYRTVGGALVGPNDAGACPPGRHLVGDRSENDPTFACVAAPAACASALVFDCSCAASVCTSPSRCPFQCASATETQVECVCAVP